MLRENSDLEALTRSRFEVYEGTNSSAHITRLRESENLEEAARAVLKCLGELKRPYLSEFEEKLLSFIEQECKAGD
ncbi:MAG: hypothetical protein KME32_34885 [Mojavia pulchra JT2-VF2]|jgi:DNA-directed RNA polymerase subunit L|uniref:Uncharacterized protein n=1 Tax=Mojavia pulchra JT2-VF2 TaxID=287848 RepID=A0A951Q7P9_9NOST|nr:hypothetical protein [Mojavia pulchra JT2-VF2]